MTAVIFLPLNLQKELSLDTHFCFRFGTIVIIFSFIDVERCGRQQKGETFIKRRDKKGSMIIDEVAKFDNLNKEAEEI